MDALAQLFGPGLRVVGGQGRELHRQKAQHRGDHAVVGLAQRLAVEAGLGQRRQHAFDQLGRQAAVRHQLRPEQLRDVRVLPHRGAAAVEQLGDPVLPGERALGRRDLRHDRGGDFG
ncbi:hypothetical protein D9M72_474970 [compost metagenome]